MPLADLPAWQALQHHFDNAGKGFNLKVEFDKDPTRFEKLSHTLENDGSFLEILFDFSKNLVSHKTLDLLVDLAHAVGLERLRDDMIAGKKVNNTEKRAVSHVALRDIENADGQTKATLHHMRVFSEQIRRGTWKGYTGKNFNTVINIGIGGSDLGPLMVCKALAAYGDNNLTLHFVSNIDGTHIAEALKNSDPETTIFIIASKSFTTAETMQNANTALAWFLCNAKDNRHIERHFVAVSTNAAAVQKFGISLNNMFPFSESVGGRYSVWGPIGLIISLYIGYDNFVEFLQGGHRMDTHFLQTPLRNNIPVLGGLISVWYINFFGATSHMVSPFDQYLAYFPAYLQQLSMESNGKRIGRDHKPVAYATAPVLFGETGTNAQHSYFQLLHQGTNLIPTDLILPVKSHNLIADAKHHKMLAANFIAQSEALMVGKSADTAHGHGACAAPPAAKSFQELAIHESCPGNRPTTSILVEQITPGTLGCLIAYYEHVTFSEGVVWNINSFDNFGVELGKTLADRLLAEINGEENGLSHHDQSTRGLLNTFKRLSRNA